MIDHVLLDLDGVCADFVSGAMSLWDMTPASLRPGEWEIANCLGVSTNQFWKRIDETPDFWRNLAPYPWKDDLIARIDGLGIPWTIATAPNKDPLCAAQKLWWIAHHISREAAHKAMLGSQKHLMANPFTALIDDNETNVDDFLNAGGHTVLFPALWNRRGVSHDPVGDVMAELQVLIEKGLDGDDHSEIQRHRERFA